MELIVFHHQQDIATLAILLAQTAMVLVAQCVLNATKAIIYWEILVYTLVLIHTLMMKPPQDVKYVITFVISVPQN